MRKDIFFILIAFIIYSHGLIVKINPIEDDFEILGRRNFNQDDFKRHLKSKDISTYNWLLQYHNFDWYYYMPRMVGDTQAVRFVTPTINPCSLVAIGIYNYNTTTGQVGQPYYIFVADKRHDIDYDTFPGFYEAIADSDTLLKPLGTIIAEFTSTAKENGVEDIINCEISLIDEDTVYTKEFFIGYTPGHDSFAILSSGYIPYDTPRNSHSYRYRKAWNLWYGYYFSQDNTKLEIGINAYLRVYYITYWVVIERLPNTYSTLPRKVYADTYLSSQYKTDSLVLEYMVNNGIVNRTYLSLFSGDSFQGIWEGYIPGFNTGDTITYRGIGYREDGKTKETPWYSYVIKSGTPGNGLFVKGRNYSTVNFDDYIENNFNLDVWDINAENGPPDSSVFAFYTYGPGFPAVIWKGWGEYDLSYVNYGGIIFRKGDTTYVRELINNGGGFWLEDQDGLYALEENTWHDYGQHNTQEGSFLNSLGIYKATDDGLLSQKSYFHIYGYELDPVLQSLFSGVSNQTPGSILHGAVNGDSTKEWTGSIDSVSGNILRDMFAIKDNDTIFLSLRYENTKNGKFLLHISQVDWIASQNQPLYFWDYPASDTMNYLYLKWLGLSYVGINEKDLNLLSIGNPDLKSGELMIKIFIPQNSYLMIDIYDILGRNIKNIYSREAVGLITISYPIKEFKSGTYFLNVKVNGESKGVKKFFILK